MSCEQQDDQNLTLKVSLSHPTGCLPSFPATLLRFGARAERLLPREGAMTEVCSPSHRQELGSVLSAALVGVALCLRLFPLSI